jgi:hypothetical protein
MDECPASGEDSKRDVWVLRGARATEANIPYKMNCLFSKMFSMIERGKFITRETTRLAVGRMDE